MPGPPVIKISAQPSFYLLFPLTNFCCPSLTVLRCLLIASSYLEDFSLYVLFLSRLGSTLEIISVSPVISSVSCNWPPVVCVAVMASFTQAAGLSSMSTIACTPPAVPSVLLVSMAMPQSAMSIIVQVPAGLVPSSFQFCKCAFFNSMGRLSSSMSRLGNWWFPRYNGYFRDGWSIL